MTRAVEVEGRELVITTDGRVERTPVPDGFSPSMFRHIVAGADLLYRRNGVMPTINDIVREWDGYTKASVSAAYNSPEFAAALSKRGIEVDPKKGLTSEQLYALTILQDPTDRRSTKAKLEAVGIPVAKYRAWMRNSVFSAAMNQQAEHNLGDAVQMALNRLVSNAEAGDNRAIEKILEISGRWNPQQQEVQNARTVVLTFMEVIQSEIHDKEVLSRIMSKVRDRMDVLVITQGLKEL